MVFFFHTWKNQEEKDMNIEIRRFRDEDATDAAELVRYTLRTSNSKDYPAESIDAIIASHTPETIKEYAHNGHFYVVTDSGKVIGIGGIAAFWGSPTESILLTIFVHPDYQGKGIGRRIIGTLEEDEYFLRAERIEIPASVTGVPFYLKCGYTYKNNVTEPDEEGSIRLEKYRGGQS